MKFWSNLNILSQFPPKTLQGSFPFKTSLNSPITSDNSDRKAFDFVHIVDYKSTSQKTEGKIITLDDVWKAGYKRQMDLYVWVMRQMGHDVSSLGYFLYCDGDRFGDYEFLNASHANMRFLMSLIPYEVDTSWIEPTLTDIRMCLNQTDTPDHADQCEYGRFLAQIKTLNPPNDPHD